MVSHHSHQPLPTPRPRHHHTRASAHETARGLAATSGMGEYEEDDVFLSAPSSPSTTPPSSPAAAHQPYGRDLRPVRAQTIVNITVNATTAPVTVQTGDLPRNPPTPPLPATPVRRHAIAADTHRSTRSARSSQPPAGCHAPPSTPSTPKRRAIHVPDIGLLSPLSPPSRRAPSRPPTRLDAEATARRMREIERALEDFRLEQMQQTAESGSPAEPAATDGNTTRPSSVHPADEHIDPPEVGRRKWYVAIVAAKVGIFKHYSEMAQYLRVSQASHEKTSSRDEAERLYYDCKAKGLVRVVKK